MAVGNVNVISDNVLHNFAKRLANNEPKLRRVAVKKLRLWLQAKSCSFGETELLKIWKGLHYCFWMADKPLMQEELAECISGLLSCFSSFSTSLVFVKTFFMTQAREWSGTDQLRMDKFMMLIRRMLRHILITLKQRGWQHQDIVDFSTTLHASAIDGLNDRIPDGLRYHLVDVYVDELDKLAGDELHPDHRFEAVKPFCRLVAESSNKVLASYCLKTMFTPLLKNSSSQINSCKLADYFFKLAAKRSCRNRSMVYKFVNRCRDMGKSTSDDVGVDDSVLQMTPDADEGDDDGIAIETSCKKKYQMKTVQNGDQCKPSSNSKKRKRRQEELVDEQHQAVGKRKRLKSEADFNSDDSNQMSLSNVKGTCEKEVEIWIPNRKYTGPMASKFAEAAAAAAHEIGEDCKSVKQSCVESFTSNRKSPAVVKKCHKTPKTEPKKTVSVVSDSVMAMSTGQRKTVKFAKNLTQSQNFEDSLNVTPKPAFDPRLLPNRAILKISASKTPKKQLFRPRSKVLSNFA